MPGDVPVVEVGLGVLVLVVLVGLVVGVPDVELGSVVSVEVTLGLVLTAALAEGEVSSVASLLPAFQVEPTKPTATTRITIAPSRSVNFCFDIFSSLGV